MIPMGTEAESVALAARLRKEGLRVSVETVRRKMKKSLDYANREGIPFVIILGENEAESGKIVLKAMLTHDSKEFALEDAAGIAAYVKG